MNHTTTEVQPLDDCYAAFIIGGTFCLAASVLVASFIVWSWLPVSADGSGIAILLFLSTGFMLINRGLSARVRIRTEVGVT